MYCDDLLDQYNVDRKMGALISKLAALMRKHGEGIYASNDTLGKMLRLSTRTVQRWLSILIDKGILAIKYVTTVKRYIYFTEEFAKCLNNINGGGLKGQSIPKQYTKAFVCSKSEHLNDCEKTVKSNSSDFTQNDVLKYNHDKNAENKRESLTKAIINKVRSNILKVTSNLCFYNKEKENNISFSPFSRSRNITKEKEKNISCREQLNKNQSSVNFVKQNLDSFNCSKFGYNNLSHSSKSDLDCYPLNCKKDINMKFDKTIEDFWDDEEEKEKNSAKKEKEVWDHVNSVATTRWGQTINPQEEKNNQQLSEENVEVKQDPLMQYRHERAIEKMMLVNSPECPLLNKYQLGIIRDYGDCSNDTNLSAKAKEYYARIRKYAMQKLEAIERVEKEKEAEKNALIERELKIKNSDPDGLHPAVRAEVDKFLKHLDLKPATVKSIILTAQLVTRALINDPNAEPRSLLVDAFSQYYPMLNE